ncbi:MAG: LacI family DNA-binding transcriptional regulator [Bacteroidetes bacterium]|nr:LacI family DNA-binding transcriptional regulator [Bacteroidota bacterium]
MSLTLEDIARRAGVSRATVSRVINGENNVKEQTRVQVMEVIQQSNFQPNVAARSLAAGRTNVIGLIIPAGVSAIFTDPYFPYLIQSVSLACNTKDYSTMLWLAEPEFERRMMRQILHSGLLDGVIVSSMLMEDPIVLALHGSRKPFVLFGRHPKLDVNYIDAENVRGGYEATLHLMRLGHKRIATITGPQNMIAGYDRFEGYRKALEGRGFAVLPELITEGDFSEASGYIAAQRLLAANPTAIFVASDTMAEGAIRALHNAGLRVPQDVAIVGFDDMPNASRTNPPLTTIRQPTRQMGALAVNTLIDIIQNPGEHKRHIILPIELVIRESCGTLPA